MKTTSRLVVAGTITLLLLLFTTALGALAAPRPFQALSPTSSSPEPDIHARRVISPEIESLVHLTPDGQVALLQVNVWCEAGEIVEIEVRLKIEGAPAIAMGGTERSCSDNRSWTVQAVPVGTGSLQPGTGRACALLRTRSEEQGHITASRHWCNAVEVVR